MGEEGSHRTEKVTAVVTAISTAVTMAAFVYSVWVNEQTNDRLSAEKEEEYVQHVSLQEAPTYACAAHAECSDGGGVQWVLMNFNSVQLAEVWVEGSDSASVKMFNVPACSMYAVPVGFLPGTAYFTDPHGRWRVATEGTYSKSDRRFPDQDSDDSGWVHDIANCP